MRRIKHPGLRYWAAGAAVVLAVAVLAVSAVRLSAQPSSVTRVSVNSAGIEANADSFFPALNADGRIVGFKSLATNLAEPLPEQTQFDVYVHDRDNGDTTRVSVTSFGFVPNDNSFPPALNGDGNLVAFASEASNMVPNDQNSGADVFVRNRGAATTAAVSLTNTGMLPATGGSRDLPPSIDTDGRRVAFETTAVLTANDPNTDIADVYVRDREDNTTELISVRTLTLDPEPALAPAISGNGCIVAFVSPSGRLVPEGQDPNERLDVYARDRCSDPQTTALLTRGFDGSPTTRDSQQSLFPPGITTDGELVAFESEAINLVPNDTNNVSDVFVNNRVSGNTERVSINTYGEQGDAPSTAPAISGNGRYVVFVSSATNFVEGTDGRANIFVRDRFADQTCQVSLGEGLSQAAGDSVNPAISADGRWIGFESTAELVPGGTEGRRGIYVVENIEANQQCPPTPTPTETPIPPTPTPGRDDCCQCGTDACEEPGDGLCPGGCEVVFQAACLGEPLNCATFTPSSSTPTPGAEDCCACPGDTCEEPADGECPSQCEVTFQAACLDEGCATFTPTPTPTARPTLGANDCCECPGIPELCANPSGGSCPEACAPVYDAGCIGDVGPLGGVGAGLAVGCVTNTPTLSPTPTRAPGEDDCCDCPGLPELCVDPSGDTCPEGCEAVFDAACLGAPQGCVANTPTPTPGDNDCCDCPSNPNLCTDPEGGLCPNGCEVAFDASCEGAPEGCVANTPTASPTPTRTNTVQTSTPTRARTPGSNDCCACPENPDLCAVPSGGACPTGCTEVFDAACLGAPQGCVANTPTRTPGGSTPTRTPTSGQNSGGSSGCGCETKPQPRNMTLVALRDLVALFGPAVLVWRLRRRRRLVS